MPTLVQLRAFISYTKALATMRQFHFKLFQILDNILRDIEQTNPITKLG